MSSGLIGTGSPIVTPVSGIAGQDSWVEQIEERERNRMRVVRVKCMVALIRYCLKKLGFSWACLDSNGFLITQHSSNIYPRFLCSTSSRLL